MKTETVTFGDNLGLIDAYLDDSQIAGIEDDGDEWLVCWGPSFQRSRHFASLEAAKAWISKNAGDIQDDTVG